MPPFPNMWTVGLPFDLPFDLLTWISIEIIYSSRTMYLPSLKLLGQSVLELTVAPGVGDWYDLDLWPTDLNINRDHLLIKDFLPTKFEAFEAKRSWVISCTRYGRSTWPLTLTFDLLTWKSIGIIYLSLTIYLLSLKLVGQSIVELSVAQGIEDQHDLWPWPLTYWPEYQQGSSTHQGLSTYQVKDRQTCAMQYALLFPGGGDKNITHILPKH